MEENKTSFFSSSSSLLLEIRAKLQRKAKGKFQMGEKKKKRIFNCIKSCFISWKKNEIFKIKKISKKDF
jgi:hypothetical protein